MTNPNQLCDVLLFVCSKMADETNLSSALPVADRTKRGLRMKALLVMPWLWLSAVHVSARLRWFFLLRIHQHPFSEVSILCNLFPRLCWYVEVFKGGFEGVLVSLLLTTMGAFSNVVLPRGFSLANVHQAKSIDPYQIRRTRHLIKVYTFCIKYSMFINHGNKLGCKTPIQTKPW